MLSNLFYTQSGFEIIVVGDDALRMSAIRSVGVPIEFVCMWVVAMLFWRKLMLQLAPATPTSISCPFSYFLRAEQ